MKKLFEIIAAIGLLLFMAGCVAVLRKQPQPALKVTPLPDPFLGAADEVIFPPLAKP